MTRRHTACNIPANRPKQPAHPRYLAAHRPHNKAVSPDRSSRPTTNPRHVGACPTDGRTAVLAAAHTSASAGRGLRCTCGPIKATSTPAACERPPLPLNDSSATKRTGHQPRRDAHRRRPDSGAGGCLHGSLRAAWRATPPTPAGSSQQPLGSDTTHQTSLHQRARVAACADEGARVRPDGSARGNPHEDCAGDAACDAPNGHWQQPTAPGT